MQISFNPLIHAEREAVIKFLGLADRVIVESRPLAPADLFDHRSAVERQADAEEDETSADPLPPPAPSTAAADLFSTAPAVPQAGEVTPPPAAVPHAPTAPPVAPVPSALATAAPPVPGADVDSTGLPWDGRIHGENKTKNKDGTWRQRRNLDPTVLASVTAELRGVMAIPPGGAPAVAPVPNAAPVTSPPASVPTPTPPVAPVPPTAAASSAPDTGVTFLSVLQRITSNVTALKITEAQVHEVLQSVGLRPQQIGMLATRADLLPAVNQQLDAILGPQQ